MEWFLGGFVITALASVSLLWLFWDRQEGVTRNISILFLIMIAALLALELEYSFHVYWGEREKELMFQAEACSDTLMVERHERQQDACRSSRMVTGKSFGKLVNERVYYLATFVLEFLSRNAITESVTPAFIQMIILIILFSLILVVSRSYVDADRARSNPGFDSYRNAMISTELFNALSRNSGKRIE